MRKYVLVLAAVAAVMAAQSASAKDCRKSYYQGSNAALLTGRYINIAKENAIISWSLRVTASLGPVYADWSNARNKRFRCVKRAGRHKCTARAQACTD